MTSGRITGIGGIFVTCKDKEALTKWYQDILGVPWDGYGSNFAFRDNLIPNEAYSLWSAFPDDTDYLAPSTKEFMINFRVDDLKAFLETLKGKGVETVGEMLDEPYGKFAWIMDPEGTKIELWEQVGPFPTEECAAEELGE